jgi:hypothetical protein
MKKTRMKASGEYLVQKMDDILCWLVLTGT